MGLSTLTLITLLTGVGQVPNDLSTINHRNIQIPLKFVAGRRTEVKELLLFVSRDEGKFWGQEAVATPDKEAFPFFAPADGIYWFQVMIVDKRGARDPMDLYSTPPGLKVLVDTTAPVIRLNTGEPAGDEVSVAWDIQELYPDLKSFRLEYAAFGSGAAPAWQPVSTQPAIKGSARFRPSTPGPVRVKLTVLDMAGNKGEVVKDVAGPGSGNVVLKPAPTAAPLQQMGLNPTPPVTNLVMPEPTPTPRQDSTDLVMPAVPPPTPIGSSNEPAPAPPYTPRQPFQPVPQPQPVQQPQVTVPQMINAVPPPQVTEIGQMDPTGANPLAVSNANMAPTPAPTLPAPQSVRDLEFDLAYDVEQVGPSGVAKAELWVTRDDGRTWIKWSEDEDRKSPIAVNLNSPKSAQVEGLYGFKVVLQSGAGLSKGPPVAGDTPDLRIDVDVTAPLVKIYNPMPDPNQRDILNLRWEAVDRNMAQPDPITLEWSEMPDGPWRPIVGAAAQQMPALNAQLGTSANTFGTAQRVANTGTYPWKLPPNMPSHRVYLRISARDTAGNVAVARTPQPIEVDLQKPVAKIQGIVGGRR